MATLKGDIRIVAADQIESLIISKITIFEANGAASVDSHNTVGTIVDPATGSTEILHIFSFDSVGAAPIYIQVIQDDILTVVKAEHITGAASGLVGVA